MSGHAETTFPKGALWGAAGLIAFAMLGTFSVRAGLLPHVANPEAMRQASAVALVESRDLMFLDRADGAVLVTDTAGNTVSVILPSSEHGFVRGVLRGLARERRLKGASPEAPFRLAAWTDHGLTLTDLATGRQIELGAFGPTNREAFAVLLPSAGQGSRP